MSLSHMPARNWVGFILILLSLALLYPGLTQPMLNLTLSAKLPLLGNMEFYNKTQSILVSIRSLYESNNALVAVLILLFSVVVPIAKAICLLAVLFVNNAKLSRWLHNIVSAIGKWSMADVFVVGIFMAFLAGNAHPGAQATLHSGFYYFTAYCVASILSAQCIKVSRQT